MDANEELIRFLVGTFVLVVLPTALWVAWPRLGPALAQMMTAISSRLAGPSWWSARLRDAQTSHLERLTARVATLERLSAFNDAAIIEARIAAVEDALEALAERVDRGSAGIGVCAPAPPRHEATNGQSIGSIGPMNSDNSYGSYAPHTLPTPVAIGDADELIRYLARTTTMSKTKIREMIRGDVNQVARLVDEERGKQV